MKKHSVYIIPTGSNDETQPNEQQDDIVRKDAPKQLRYKLVVTSVLFVVWICEVSVSRFLLSADNE